MIIEQFDVSKPFRPFGLKLVCETREEMFFLWHLFNTSGNDLAKRARENFRVPFQSFSGLTEKLWGTINVELEGRGLPNNASSTPEIGEPPAP